MFTESGTGRPGRLDFILLRYYLVLETNYKYTSGALHPRTISF